MFAYTNSSTTCAWKQSRIIAVILLLVSIVLIVIMKHHIIGLWLLFGAIYFRSGRNLLAVHIHYDVEKNKMYCHLPDLTGWDWHGLENQSRWCKKCDLEERAWVFEDLPPLHIIFSFIIALVFTMAQFFPQ